ELVQAASKLPRPDPLPLLSTGLFETPDDQMRTPDDPTGGVSRPLAGSEPPIEPLLAPVATEPDDLVILPLDSDIGSAAGGHVAEPDLGVTAALPTDVASGAHTEDLHEQVTVTEAIPAVAASPEPRRRRGFPWKLVLAVLVVAALAVLGVLASQLFATPTYMVPDLVELPEAEARNLVAANGWDVSVETERSDLVPVVGRVVRTAPGAGVELAEGEPFLIVVSQGPTLRELPESTGVPLSEAQTRLIERGLDVRTVEAFDEDVAPDVVISWTVPGDPTLTAGAEVEPETLVELVVSIGPAPRAVPEVTGGTLAEAQALLDPLGLSVAEIGQEFSDDAPLGAILSQSIDPGEEVERGTTIGVVTSIGPDLVAFPDISTAANYDEAAEILFQAGFTSRLVFGDAEGEVQSYRIDGETPDVGQTFRRGTQVDIRAL
ncbi:MAG: PASTA domain-containing protein, partial [Ilumatobacter sp.]|nr:PASTA domain-containing protein [Ilumatobacter sp.]